MNIEKEIKGYLSGIREVFKKVPVNTIEEIVQVLLKAYEDDKKVITMGNGGHASTASHHVNDLTKHTIVSDEKNEVIVKEKRFKALCLNDSIATLTGWANDVGYESCFSEPLAGWVEEGDVVIGISASGNSQNILRAFRVAKDKKAITIALSGYQGGKIKDIADICLIVPSDDILFIEDLHFSLAHLWTSIIRRIIQKKYAGREESNANETD